MVKKIIFISFILLLVFIAAWKLVSGYSPAPVAGVYETTPKPEFSVASFLNEIYQEQFTKYVEDLRGLKGIFTRIRNQADYSFFGIPHATKIVRGKRGCLFGEENILAYLGRNYTGAHYFDIKVRELKSFQDFLWKEKKILLLVIFTPDKSSFYPELIPDRFLRRQAGMNNYQDYSVKCREAGVNVIDFNNYFILAKDTSRYPLFARTGIHWSTYGAVLAADSLVRYLEIRLGMKMPEIAVDRIEMSSMPRDDDDDISRTMNLFFSIPQPELAYPVFHYQKDSLTKKPAALFIGDSYYWNWQRKGIIHNLFRNAGFWYYDQEVYPESLFKPTYTWNLDLKKAIERQNVIILLQTNNWKDYDFGHGFVDRAWAEYDPSPGNRVRCIEQYLTRGGENMPFYRKKSEEQRVPLETIIRREAIFAGNNLLLNKK